MKSTIFQPRTFAFLVLGMLSMLLPSFSSKPGGEGFEIYLNNKLIVRQFAGSSNKITHIQLDPATANGEFTIQYFHCGRPGKDRNISIKNVQNKVLKTFHYGDAKDTRAVMLCKVKDITSLQKSTKDTQLKLYYSSTEIPSGRLLASINLVASDMARN